MIDQDPKDNDNDTKYGLKGYSGKSSRIVHEYLNDAFGEYINHFGLTEILITALYFQHYDSNSCPHNDLKYVS